jgi:TonB family protein
VPSLFRTFKGIAFLVLILVIDPLPGHARETVWRKAPKPKFPQEALKAFSEGSVTIRVVIAPDGSVTNAQVTKSSGNAQLDAAALETARKWIMEPAAITPSDLHAGRPIVFDFKQEAVRAARYRDRAAWFANKNATDRWVFAPFPEYSEYARRFRYQGTVKLRVTIGRQGLVSNVEILQSSGHSDLDNAAVVAVRRWRAHKRYEGTTGVVPVTFTVRRS